MIVAMLPKKEFTCRMCTKYVMSNNSYIYRTFEILPKTPSEELEICRMCAKREHGDKNKHKLEDIIEERTEKWQKQKHQGLKEQKSE